MNSKMRSFLAGEGTTGAGGGTGAGAGNGTTGTAGAGGTGAAGAAAGAGAGTAGAAGAAGAGAGANGGAASGGTGFVGGAAGTSGQGQGQGAGTAGAGQAGAAQPYTLTLPEGVSNVDKPLFEGFTKVANEKGLPKEQAQAVVDFYSKQIAERNKADVAAYEQRQKDQRKALETHPKIGGANLAKSQELARRAVLALDKLDPGLGTEFAKELVDAGLADSPAAARLLVLIGEQLAEDTVGASAGGGTAAGAGKKPLTKEQRLAQEFPSLAKDLLGSEAST